MSVEFNKEYELGDFAYFSNEKISAEEVSQEEYISTENMVVDRGGVEKASKLPSVSKFNSFQKTDTLFSNIRTYFRKVWMASFDGGASADVLAFRTKDENALDPAYLYYLISNKDFSDYSVLTAKGVKMPRGDKTAMMQYKFLLPDPEKQLQYASALKSLDDKIENNRRMNETLEGMAQAIFKSWFVDFDPVHAKVEALKNGGSEDAASIAAMCAISGKTAEALAQLKSENPDDYAQLATTADAFPSSFIDSDLGQIPEGWEVTTFGEVSNCFDNKRIPLSKRQREERPGNIPYYGATSVMDYVDEPIFDGIYLLLGEDGSVLKENGTPFTQYIWGKSWVNNHAHVLQGTNGISTEHLLTFINRTNIAAYITGAVQLKLNQRNMNSIQFFQANQSVNQAFDARLQALFAAYRNNSVENQSLAETRDALLPKLLSGEIDVMGVNGE